MLSERSLHAWTAGRLRATSQKRAIGSPTHAHQIRTQTTAMIVLARTGDADHDGVPDNLDQCPDTPLGTTVDASGCPVAPPPGCVNSVGTGTGTVLGQVFVDDPGQNFPYLAGWCVELRDGSGAVIATAVTSGVALDVEGNNYVFTGIPGGSYTVCEVLPPNTTWHETTPTSGPDCGGGVFGQPATFMDGGSADLIWFGNLP